MNPYLALLKQEKEPHAPLSKLTEAPFGSFGSTPDSRIYQPHHPTAHDRMQGKQSHTSQTKPTKAAFDSFDSDTGGPLEGLQQQSAGPLSGATGSADPLSKDPFGSFGSGMGSHSQPVEDGAAPATHAAIAPADQADQTGQFEGRCDILVWHNAITRQDADALVRLHSKNRDVAETKLLHLEHHHGLSRCLRCVHSRRPGNTLHCGNQNRNDLERAYGLLRFIPHDGGATCPFWIKTDD